LENLFTRRTAIVKGLKGTVVNRALPSLHGGLLVRRFKFLTNAKNETVKDNFFRFLNDKKNKGRVGLKYKLLGFHGASTMYSGLWSNNLNKFFSKIM